MFALLKCYDLCVFIMKHANCNFEPPHRPWTERYVGGKLLNGLELHANFCLLLRYELFPKSVGSISVAKLMNGYGKGSVDLRKLFGFQCLLFE